MQIDEDGRPGFLLTFEGPDGSGKSTQVRRVMGELTAAGYDCVLTREPGGTAVGEEIRRLLLDSPSLSPSPATDTLLFNAARAQLVDEVIGPALARGQVVVCDRFADSTLAYQGFGAGGPLDQIQAVNQFATGGLTPDLTILVDIPVDDGLRRKLGEENRFESTQDKDFHQRVRDGFKALAEADPARFVVVDGGDAPDKVEQAILAHVLPALRAHPVRSGNESEDLKVAPDENPARSGEPIDGPVRMDS